MELEQDILVCRHWKNKGVCRMREICKFSHPVELCGIDKRDRMRVGTWQRKPVINDGRAGVLRRWLLSTFGESYLNSGSGILDVAGGKGEVSFELLNLNNIQCTVIDPRPLELDRFKRKLVCGFYHKNEMLNRYNSLPYSIYCTPIANEKASNCEKHHETAYNITNNTKVNSMDTLDSEGEKEQEPWKEALIHRYSNNCKSPRHIRLLFEMFLSYGKTLELPELKYKIPKALWDRKSFEIGLSYGKTLNNDGSKSKDKIVIDTNIENGNVPNNQERISNELNASIGTKSAKSVPFNEIECYEDALQIIQNCSVVVGMHPDQATEHLIEFCLRNKKPFAVFPCCVCYKQFQQRTHNGVQVRKYGQFVDYLQSKSDEICALEMDFEGKNIMLYYLGDVSTWSNQASSVSDAANVLNLSNDGIPAATTLRIKQDLISKAIPYIVRGAATSSLWDNVEL